MWYTITFIAGGLIGMIVTAVAAASGMDAERQYYEDQIRRMEQEHTNHNQGVTP